MKKVEVCGIEFSNDLPLVLIAGPCQIESTEHAVMVAGALSEAAGEAGLGFVYKSSFDKANRTSLRSRRGVGFEHGIDVLAEVKRQIGCPVLTDVHEPAQCAAAAETADVIQIPAYLCRQTDLLLAAGRTGAAINVKKGQFLAPWDMRHVAGKISATGNDRILLCERGTCFGYNNLIADMRSLHILAQTGYPVVMDATHSLQLPGGQGSSSGGQREFAPVVARAAAAVGVAAIFIETHEDPDNAPSDGPNMVPLEQMPELVATLAAFDKLAKSASSVK